MNIKSLFKKYIPYNLLLLMSRVVSFVLIKIKFIKFIKDIIYFRKKMKDSSDCRFDFKLKNLYPILHENSKYTGFDRHYIYHPAWAARVLKKINPSLHIDISSTLNFCSIVSAFIPVSFYDYRPAKLELSGLSSDFIDLLNLPFETETVESLSCMHTIEHLGLGRYGDPIDPQADLRAIYELKRIVKIGGSLLIVVPIGRSELRFNAERVYGYKEFSSLFNDMRLMEFALIPDEGPLVINPSDDFICKQIYGCGCFWYKKL